MEHHLYGGAFLSRARADNSSKYWEMDELYEHLTWGNNSYYTANMIDAAWIIAQAVLETKPSFSTRRFSINAVDIMEVLPDVASRYYGYSGWCQLDEARAPMQITRSGVMDSWMMNPVSSSMAGMTCGQTQCTGMINFPIFFF